MELNSLSIFMIISSLIALLLGVYSFNQRKEAFAFFFSMLMFAIFTWTFFYGIAEDVEMNMLLAKMLISRKMPHAQLIEATNGKKTLELVQSQHIDLIFMDVHMPEMDGLETTKAIRKWEKSNSIHIPIIALTAGALTEETNKCIDAGMNDILTKPIDTDKLEMLLDQYFPN